MNNKILIAILSILTVFFLTAQTCSFGGVSTGLAADCVGEGDIVCDGTEAYQCQLATYGIGFYVSRASGYDVSDCGAEEEKEVFDSDVLSRKLITVSSDLEKIIEELKEIKVEASAAEANGNSKALQSMKEDLRDIRASLSEISDVMDNIAESIDDASAAGEDVADVQTLYGETNAALVMAENLLTEVSVQVIDALLALSGSDATSDSDATTDTDGDGYSDEDETTAGTDFFDSSYFPCFDSDASSSGVYGDLESRGTVTGGQFVSTGDMNSESTDSCTSSGNLIEYWCVYDNSVSFNYFDCSIEVGLGSTCADGACLGAGIEDSNAGTDSNISSDYDPSFIEAKLDFLEDNLEDYNLDEYLVLDLMDDGSEAFDYGEVWDTSLPSYQPTMNLVGGELYLTFDSDDYLQFEDDDKLDFTEWFVVDAVVRTDAGYLSNTGPIVTKTLDGTVCNGADGYNAYILRQYTTGYQFASTASGSTNRLYTPSSYNSPAGATSSSDWVRVTGVWDGAMMYIYVDEVSLGSNAQTSVKKTTGDLKIGTACNNFFVGDISDLKIFGE